jgi:hypothetical protein
MNENPFLSHPTSEPGNPWDDDQPLTEAAGGGQSPVPPAPPGTGSHLPQTDNRFDEATDQELEEYIEARIEEAAGLDDEFDYQPDDDWEPDYGPDEMTDWEGEEIDFDPFGGDEGD